MSEFSIDPTLLILLSVHFINGAIATIIAQKKGYGLAKWLILGLIGGTFTLYAAVFMKKNDSNQ